MARSPKSLTCPCGSVASYQVCCGRFIEHKDVPRTALELMRSRYSAYVLDDIDYLRQTWHRDTRSAAPTAANAQGVKWIGLDVLHHAEVGATATVEFVARYKLGGRALRMHEISRFVREEGRWFYLNGRDPEIVFNPAAPSQA